MTGTEAKVNRSPVREARMWATLDWLNACPEKPGEPIYIDRDVIRYFTRTLGWQRRELFDALDDLHEAELADVSNDGEYLVVSKEAVV